MSKAVKESVVEAYLVKRVEAVGGEVRKVKWIGRSKAPDRFVMLPNQVGVRNLWVELKRPGGKHKFPCNAHERGQAYEHRTLRFFGELVFVIDSIDDVNGLLAS
jgi:hypothetical protein